MLTLTDNAQKAVQRFLRGSDQPVTGLRVAVAGGGCSGLEYKVRLEEAPEEGDTVFESGPIKLFVDPTSAPYLHGVTVDFVEGLTSSGFKFENPNAKSSCGCGSSFQV